MHNLKYIKCFLFLSFSCLFFCINLFFVFFYCFCFYTNDSFHSDYRSVIVPLWCYTKYIKNLSFLTCGTSIFLIVWRHAAVWRKPVTFEDNLYKPFFSFNFLNLSYSKYRLLEKFKRFLVSGNKMCKFYLILILNLLLTKIFFSPSLLNF